MVTTQHGVVISLWPLISKEIMEFMSNCGIEINFHQIAELVMDSSLALSKFLYFRLDQKIGYIHVDVKHNGKNAATIKIRY